MDHFWEWEEREKVMCVCMFKNELPGVGGCVRACVWGGNKGLFFLLSKILKRLQVRVILKSSTGLAAEEMKD